MLWPRRTRGRRPRTSLSTAGWGAARRCRNSETEVSVATEATRTTPTWLAGGWEKRRAGGGRRAGAWQTASMIYFCVEKLPPKQGLATTDMYYLPFPWARNPPAPGSLSPKKSQEAGALVCTEVPMRQDGSCVHWGCWQDSRWTEFSLS